MTSTVGVSVVSNAVSGLATSVTRDSIGNAWLGEQNDIGKNAIKSTIGGGAFGGINAGLGGVGASVKGIPNLVKNAGITGLASAGASITEDIIGNVAFGENNSVLDIRNNALIRGGIATIGSGALNYWAVKTNNINKINGYDYYDIASYLASRRYSNNSNINLSESDISDEIAKYLATIKNDRLKSAILDGANLNNCNLSCDVN